MYTYLSLILVIKQDRRAQIGTHRHVSSYAFMVDKEKQKKRINTFIVFKEIFFEFFKIKK